jgi:hypothetical protein
VTTTVAPVMQWCFTTCMAAITNTKSRRESIYEKADRICADPSRVEVVRAQGEDFWVGVVTGDNGRYPVFAISQEFMDDNGLSGGRIGCAGHRGAGRKLCSHAIVAEEMRKRGGTP